MGISNTPQHVISSSICYWDYKFKPLIPCLLISLNEHGREVDEFFL